jgi:hypothetical protein
MSTASVRSRLLGVHCLPAIPSLICHNSRRLLLGVAALRPEHHQPHVTQAGPGPPRSNHLSHFKNRDKRFKPEPDLSALCKVARHQRHMWQIYVPVVGSRSRCDRVRSWWMPSSGDDCLPRPHSLKNSSFPTPAKLLSRDCGRR